MPRAKIIKTSEFPYHITTRTNNREFVQLDLEEFWKICLKYLGVLSQDFGCVIHQFVLMTNHYHLMMSTPLENISESMRIFNGETAKEYNNRTARINHLFGKRYHPTVITSEAYYWNCVKYIFRNPVRAKICSSVTDYPYSSLNCRAPTFEWQMTDFFYQREKIIKLDVDWLNEPTRSEIDEGIRQGLRLSKFKMPRKVSGYLLEPETPRYRHIP